MLKLFIYWLGAFFIAAFVLSGTHFQSKSNDSKYYTNLVVRYHNQSWQKILTPTWGENFWGFNPDSYMRDQFPGQLILGVAITKLGVPAEQALHVIEMLLQILSLFLLVKISCHFISYETASVLFYGFMLIPLAFSYTIRANHEVGIMFFSFIALYAGLNLSFSIYWLIPIVLSTVMLLLIKGPFFIFGLSLAAIGYYFSKGKFSSGRLVFTLGLSLFVVLLTAYSFEILFYNLTTQSFFSEFYKIQIEQRAMPTAQEHSFVFQKMLNFFYYFWHYLAYSLPWSALVCIIILKKGTQGKFISEMLEFLKLRLSQCLLCSAFLFALVFSLSDRIAGRYVFPGYYLFSAWIILLLLHLSKSFTEVHLRLSRIGLHIVVPSLWLIAFALHFL